MTAKLQRSALSQALGSGPIKAAPEPAEKRVELDPLAFPFLADPTCVPSTSTVEGVTQAVRELNLGSLPGSAPTANKASGFTVSQCCALRRALLTREKHVLGRKGGVLTSSAYGAVRAGRAWGPPVPVCPFTCWMAQSCSQLHSTSFRNLSLLSCTTRLIWAAAWHLLLPPVQADYELSLRNTEVMPTSLVSHLVLMSNILACVTATSPLFTPTRPGLFGRMARWQHRQLASLIKCRHRLCPSIVQLLAMVSGATITCTFGAGSLPQSLSSFFPPFT
jgi:hypothetical protein